MEPTNTSTDELSLEEQQLGLGLPFAKEIKTVQEVLALLDSVKTLDVEDSGKPDWMRLLSMAMSLIAEVKKLQEQISAISQCIAPITALLGLDLEALKEKHPELLKMPNLEELKDSNG